MSSFHQVKHSLRLDKGLLSGSTLAIALLVLAVWIAWSLNSSVTRYEVSSTARLEVTGAAYALQADVTGKLLSSALAIGNYVHAGDTLLELESRDEQLDLALERTRQASLDPQLAALRSQMEQERFGRTDERQVLDLSVTGAQAQLRQAEVQAELADEEAARSRRLRSEGLISEADARRTAADSQSKRAAADITKAAVARFKPELQVRDRDRAVRVEEILVDVTRLQADAAASAAKIKQLEYEIEKRHLRAPVSGTLTECITVRPGAHIEEGQQLGVIVPDSKLQVVAQFAPSAALGKIRPGQDAKVKLEGFPWAQFGALPAKVSRVAGDVRDGQVRVELALSAPTQSRIPLQHGLPGSVEIEVERLSPALLLLRTAGQAVGAR